MTSDKPPSAWGISYRMLVDSVLADDLQHESMIAEYFWQESPEYLVTSGDIAAVQALNKAKTRLLLRYLDEFWKPEGL